MLKTTTKYIILKVKVEHEGLADVTELCEEVEVYYDHTDGSITESQVVAVLDNLPNFP